MVEISLAGCHDEIAYTGSYNLGKGAVAANAHCLVSAVVCNDMHFGCCKLIAVHLVDIALDGIDNFGIVEGIDMVPSPSVIPVA